MSKMGLHGPFGHLLHKLCAKKKSRESNWQFDSQPLKVRNQPDPGVCRGSATHHWKALKESYKFDLDLVLIGGLSKELWPCEVPEVQSETILGQFRDSALGVLGRKPFGCGCDGIMQRILYGGRWWLPPSLGVLSQVSPCCPWLVPTLRMFLKVY
jgi:hypothetical protein